MHTIVQRLLKPRSPHDCPACRLSYTFSSVVGPSPAPPPVRPWCEVKSRRGAPKQLNTEGFACPNRKCPYSGITDAQVHALVGDGTHGRAERIQTFRCQACHTTFTARRHTPLYRLNTPSCQVAMVLMARACGLDPSEAWRVFEYRQATITTWMSRAGEHAQALHEHSFCHLQLPHLQSDELRTRLRCSTQVLWLWLAIDPCTKLLPMLHLGPRTQHLAHTLIHSLRQILPPGCLPLFTSDGLNLYFYALTAHVGQWLEVGRRGRNVRVWQVAAGLIYKLFTTIWNVSPLLQLFQLPIPSCKTMYRVLKTHERIAETALEALAVTLAQHGCPKRMTLDRDARWVGSPAGSDFPAAQVALLRLCGHRGADL